MTTKKEASESSQKQQKAQKKQDLNLKIDFAWEQITITLSILNEQDMQADPIVKKYELYKNQNGQIIGSYLAHLLLNQKIVATQSTLCYFNFDKNSYVFGFTLAQKFDDDQLKNQKDEHILSSVILKNSEQKLIKFSSVKDDTLYIKIRHKKKPLIQSLLKEQKIDPEKPNKEKGTKEKEKKVGEVLQRVALWRKFFTGFNDQKGEYQEIDLKEAADMVGVSKKTLDDYLLQIRYGKKFGFDFNGNIDAKIGVLRKFIREQKGGID